MRETGARDRCSSSTELETTEESSCRRIEVSRLGLRETNATGPFLSVSGVVSVEESGVDAGVADSEELAFDGRGASSFFFRNCALRLAFLLLVEGLDFFLVSGAETGTSLVSKEKEKAELIARENLNALPWLASAWQKAKHWDAREVSSSQSVAAAIFTFSSELRKLMGALACCCFHFRLFYIIILFRPRQSKQYKVY